VLVIRQQGEAWDRPFAVVYEPFTGPEKSASIQSVTALTQHEKFAGFKIVSQVAARRVTQLVLTPAPETGVFEDAALGISFRGRYAVISVDDGGKCTALYLGEGSQLRYQGLEIKAAANVGAYTEVSSAQPTLTAHAPAELILPSGRHVIARIVGTGH